MKKIWVNECNEDIVIWENQQDWKSFIQINQMMEKEDLNQLN